MNHSVLPQEREASVQVVKIAEKVKEVKFRKPLLSRIINNKASQETDLLESLPNFQGSPALTAQEWQSYFDESGKLTVDPQLIKKKIFLGGLDPSIRAEAWKYLLDYYPWNSTKAERMSIIEEKKKIYEQVKNQWKSITPEELANFTMWFSRKDQIERDVVRTDRNLEPFKEYEPYLSKISNILITYSWHFWNIGYTQGMNDLVAPLIILMEDESDTYWCFVGLMNKHSENFVKTQIGIYKRLFSFSKMIKLMDPSLHSYLEKIESSHLLFCFRWLLLSFKRELEPEELYRLWDTFWSWHVPDFQMFFGFAVLLQKREEILNNKLDPDHLFKISSEISISLEPTLSMAYTLHSKFEERASQEDKNLIFNQDMDDCLVVQQHSIHKDISTKDTIYPKKFFLI
uniref:Rab-GAP TBC domain-containing protein n=1 Tax=Arcella intermedia TaxID=1963864 RepID=A0A6B2L5E7_9EUKA